MTEQRKTPPEGQALMDAQRRRAVLRSEFYALLLTSVARLNAHPEERSAITAHLARESERVSASLDATDIALVNRIAGMIGQDQTDQEAMQDAITELQRQIAALTKDAPPDDARSTE